MGDGGKSGIESGDHARPMPRIAAVGNFPRVREARGDSLRSVRDESGHSGSDPVSVISPALSAATLLRLGRQRSRLRSSVKRKRSACHRSAVAGSAGPQWLPSRCDLTASALSGRDKCASRRARAFSASPQHITPPQFSMRLTSFHPCDCLARILRKGAYTDGKLHHSFT